MDKKDEILTRYQKMASFEDFHITGFDVPGADGDAPIHAAAYLGYLSDIKVMVADGVDINLAGDIGNTPLHYAALKGHKEIIKFLLDVGANPVIKNDYDDTPLDFVKNPDEELKRWLSPQDAK